MIMLPVCNAVARNTLVYFVPFRCLLPSAFPHLEKPLARSPLRHPKYRIGCSASVLLNSLRTTTPITTTTTQCAVYHSLENTSYTLSTALLYPLLIAIHKTTHFACSFLCLPVLVPPAQRPLTRDLGQRESHHYNKQSNSTIHRPNLLALGSSWEHLDL